MENIPVEYHSKIIEKLTKSFKITQFDKNENAFTQRTILSFKKEKIPQEVVSNIYKQILEEEKKVSDFDYIQWAWITGVVVFVIVWIYAISEWGFLLGIIFGWIPALLSAIIGGLLWPIIAIAIAIFILLLIRS